MLQIGKIISVYIEAIWWNGATTPLILNLGTRCSSKLSALCPGQFTIKEKKAPISHSMGDMIGLTAGPVMDILTANRKHQHKLKSIAYYTN